MTTFSDGNVLTAAQLNSITQGTGIEDGAITLAKLAGESWTAFTPTWANVTEGTGVTSAGRYVVIGKTVHLTAKITLGTGGSVTGTFGMTLPASQTTANETVAYWGSGKAVESGGNHWLIIPELQANDSSVRFFNHNSSSVVNGSNPFTWGDNDTLDFTITYEIS